LVGGGAWLLLQVWAQTSPAQPPERFRVELGLRELVNPGADGGGVLWVQAVSAGVSIGLVPGALGLEVTAPLAVATNLDPNEGSTNLFLGNPEAILVGQLQSGSFRGSLGVGVNLPLANVGTQDVELRSGVASLSGGALTYQWSSTLLALFKLEVALALESGWLSLRGATAIPIEDVEPSGDVQVEGGYRLNDTVSIGARAGLARYQLPLVAERIIRVCIAEDPELCPKGPPPQRFEMPSAVLRLEPFVVVDLGPQLRFSWIFLAASVDPVEQLHGRHEFTASVSMGF